MTEVEAQQLVTVVVTAFPSTMAKLSAEQQRETMRTYRALLLDLDYATSNAAIAALIQTRSWMPSVADIRAMVTELQHGPVKTGAEAWGSVLSVMRSKGSWRTPGVDFAFDDPVTARVVAALNWKELCASENSISDRARFIEAYEQIAKQGRKEQTSPILVAARDARTALTGEAQPIGKLLPKPSGDVS